MTLKLLTAGTALLVAAPAMARPVSTLFVDNHWEAPVQVVVDGIPMGTLRGHAEQAFPVRPGFHSVVIRSMNGTTLECVDQWLRPHQAFDLDIFTPKTSLTVTNTGTTPLYVASGRDGLWVQPGRSESAPVPAGTVTLTASIPGRHGSLQVVSEQTVWAEPGRRNQTTFDYTPLPTRLVVQNLEPSSVRVFVDGRAYGSLAPGASFALDVRPGVHEVDVIGRNGHVVVDRAVRVDRGADTRVDAFTPRPPPPARPPSYAYAGPPHHRH
ncbi:MAG: hypothetical protein R3F61_07415 [Myxococcota bacterium]